MCVLGYDESGFLTFPVQGVWHWGHRDKQDWQFSRTPGVYGSEGEAGDEEVSDDLSPLRVTDVAITSRDCKGTCFV